MSAMLVFQDVLDVVGFFKDLSSLVSLGRWILVFLWLSFIL